jgi:hypothetical protein
MTTNVVHEMAERILPLPLESFFTPQRASDMWFGDELPPTIQDQLRSPAVTQAKMMLGMQVLQSNAVGERRRAALAEQARRRRAITHVGKRVKH